MAEYDGSIRIGTGIDKKGFEAGSKELEKEARRMTESVSDTLGEGAKVALQKQTDAFVKLNQQYADQVQKIKDLGSKLHDLQRQKVETDEFKELTKDLDKAKASLDRLYNERDRYVELGKKTPLRLELDISDAERKIKLLETDIKNLVSENKAYVPVDTSKVRQEIAAAEQKQMQMYSALQTAADTLSVKIKRNVEKQEDAQRRIEEQAEKALQRENARIQKEVENQAKLEAKEAERIAKQEAAQRRIEEQAERNLQKENARIQKEAELAVKLQEEAAEAKRIDQIRVNAVATNGEIIAKVERIKQLEQDIADLEAAETTLGYADYEDAIRELAELKQEIAEYKDEVINSQTPVEEAVQRSSEAWKKYQATLEQVKNAHAGIAPPIEATKASLTLVVDFIKEKLLGLASIIKNGLIHPLQTLKKVATGVFKIIQKVGGKALSGLANIAKKSFSVISSVAKKAFATITSGTKKSGGFLSTFASRMKGLALSLLIFNWISKGFNAMISGMKTGFSNFAGYSDSYTQNVQNMKNAMSTLGNQFAAAFAPIVQMVIPWLNSLINALTTAMTYVAQFIAVLGGKSTFTKAKKVQDDYNKSLGGTAKAADKARGALAKFDDLDVLQKQDDASGGGGGGAGEDFGDMFEEVPIENSITDLFETLKGLIYTEDWEGLGSFVAESLNNGLEKIYDIINWDNVGPRITYFVNAFTETFNSLVDNLDWDLLGRTIGTGINTIVNTLNLLIEGIDWENLGTKFSVGFRGMLDEVDWENFGNLFGNKFMISWEIFRGFVDDMWRENDFTGLSGWDELGISLGEGLNGVFEKIDLGYIGATLGSAITGIFETAIVFAETFEWEALGDNISSGINKFFQEFDGKTVAQGATKFISGILDTLIEAIDTTDWAEIWRDIIDFLVNVNWLELIGKLVIAAGQLIVGLFNGLVQAIVETDWGEVWNSFLQAFRDFFGINSPSTVMMEMGTYMIQGLLDGITSLIENVTQVWENMKATALEIWENVKNSLSEKWEAMKKTATDVFNDMKTSVSSIFEGLWNTIKGIVNSILGGVESMANGVVRAINKMIEALNAIKFDIPDWAPVLGGKSFGLNLSTIPEVSIPRLATGAVIRGGNPFMAILGDQPAGQTNIEAPIGTIEQAVENVLNRNGYNNTSSSGLNPTIVLNVDGQEFARLTLGDMLSEMNRQGYNVEVLGVT